MKLAQLLKTKISGILLMIFIFSCPAAKAQQSNTALMVKLTALRNDFINKIKADGFTPSLKPPAIIADNPPSFGNYDDTTNVLHTGNWKTLPPDLKKMFDHMGRNNKMTGETFFELGTHQWVFIHELGHWWRTCRHQQTSPYQEEVGANRIAIAYWRERDPAFLNFMLKNFRGIVAGYPNPVPKGQSTEKYLDKNYNKLAGSPAYIWCQAIMIVDADKEKPTPTFKQIIATAGKQWIQ